MRKKIFKAGSYGGRGSYDLDKLKQWVSNKKEFSVLLGHAQDWTDKGCPRTAIPIGGKVVCTEVDEHGYLYGDITYNDFGKRVVESGAYTDFSIGITQDGQPDHLALLGYVPPYLKDLDRAFSEDTKEFSDKVTYIEFKEDSMDLKQIKESLAELQVTDENAVDIQEIFNAIAEKQGPEAIEAMASTHGYVKQPEVTAELVAEFASQLGLEVITKAEPKVKTEEELRTEIAAEFAVKEEKSKMMDRATKLVPESMKHLVEFAVDAAYDKGNYDNILEFSSGDKLNPRELLNELFKDKGPMSHLLKNHTGSFEFSKKKEDEISTMEKSFNAAKERQARK